MDSFKSGDLFVKLQIRLPFTSLLEKVTSKNVFVISSAKGVSYLHPFITRGKMCLSEEQFVYSENIS